MQLNRSDLLQQQLDAQERILALEKQIAELQERRESGNRVELDLTEVFEPIREAVGRIALVRMGEISREITTELTRLVEDDLPTLDEPTNATGTVSPGRNGGAISDQAPESEAASATGGATPRSGGGPASLQPDSAAADAAESSDRPETVELVGETEGAPPPQATPAAAASPPAGAPPTADHGLRPSEEAPAAEVSRSGAPAAPDVGSGIEERLGATRPEPTDMAELMLTPHPPGSPGGLPTTEP